MRFWILSLALTVATPAAAQEAMTVVAVPQFSTPNLGACVADHCPNCLVCAHAGSRGAESHRPNPATSFGQVETQ